ncbi:MAG: L-fucose/L-arabinose isomerase family protein [Saprospiraceae bacterium]|nr:L-fucose/L-arabinose isomerase family protein [Saprospiraceae bacterium]
MTHHIAAPQELQRIKPLFCRIGVLGVGHRTYWSQFPGLLDQLEIKLVVFENRIQDSETDVVNFGISDCAERAFEILTRIRQANIDLLFIDMLTYATSSSVACIFQSLQIPIVLVALQPDAAMDYAKATTQMQLYNDDICALPEFALVAIRMGRPVPPMIIGTLENDPVAEQEIRDFVDIAKALHSLKQARIGQMGHVLEAMLDMHTDSTMLTASFGCHIVQTEVDDILVHYRGISAKEVKTATEEILSFFDTPDPKSDPITEKLSPQDLEEAARVYVALRKFIGEKKLDGLAYYYEAEEGSTMRKMISNLIVGNSILTGQGFPMCGEMDLKTCIAMLIMDRMSMGGSFAEFHPVDFLEGFVLVGHDGPHHIKIAQGKPVLRSLKKYHGKPGSGASVEFQLKAGPITMLSIGQKANGAYKFVVAEGESKAGLIPATGNTNTRGFFKPDVRTFLQRWFAEGPTHHFALGLGHRAHVIKNLGDFIGIETAVIDTFS